MAAERAAVLDDGDELLDAAVEVEITEDVEVELRLILAAPALMTSSATTVVLSFGELVYQGDPKRSGIDLVSHPLDFMEG